MKKEPKSDIGSGGGQMERERTSSKTTKSFPVHYKFPMVTANDRGCSKVMELQVSKEKDGVRVRLKWGNKATWWQYLEIK